MSSPDHAMSDSYTQHDVPRTARLEVTLCFRDSHAASQFQSLPSSEIAYQLKQRAEGAAPSAAVQERLSPAVQKLPARITSGNEIANVHGPQHTSNAAEQAGRIYETRPEAALDPLFGGNDRFSGTNFSTLETGDIFENFDFDSFLRSGEAHRDSQFDSEWLPDPGNWNEDARGGQQQNAQAGPGPVTEYNSQASQHDQTHLPLLEQQNQITFRIACKGRPTSLAAPNLPAVLWTSALQDYKLQLLHLGQQNKKRLLQGDSPERYTLFLRDFFSPQETCERMPGGQMLHAPAENCTEKLLENTHVEPEETARKIWELQATKLCHLEFMFLDEQYEEVLGLVLEEQEHVLRKKMTAGDSSNQAAVEEEYKRKLTKVADLCKEVLARQTGLNTTRNTADSTSARSQRTGVSADGITPNRWCETLERNDIAVPNATSHLNDIVSRDAELQGFQSQLHDIARDECFEIEQNVKDNIPIPRHPSGRSRTFKGGQTPEQEYQMQLMLLEHQKTLCQTRIQKEQERLKLHHLGMPQPRSRTCSAASSSDEDSDEDSKMLDDEQQQEFESRQGTFQVALNLRSDRRPAPDNLPVNYRAQLKLLEQQNSRRLRMQEQFREINPSNQVMREYGQ